MTERYGQKSGLTLQVNQSGAWRNVLQFADGLTYDVMQKAIPLARIMSPAKWRIIGDRLPGRSEAVFAHLTAPYSAWEQHDVA